MRINNVFGTLVLVLALTGAATAAEVQTSTLDDQQSVEVTVYNSNLGLVKDTRKIVLPEGVGELRFMDVAAAIMPYTVHIESLNAPNDLAVLEQNYEYDLLDANKLLNKYVGKKIKLMEWSPVQGSDKKEIVEATLLSNNGSPIYKINDEIYIGRPGYQILPELPENLIAQPTLTWMCQNTGKGPHTVQVSYLTNNISWRSDYIVVVNADDTAANLSGWVTLDNNSGATYKEAKLKLVAGQVNRVQATRGYEEARFAAMDAAKSAAPQFQEQGFFEYHLYDLQRKTTIKNNETKQISLLEANGAKVEKEFLVYGNQSYYYSRYGGDAIKPPVNVYIKFRNSKENHMGMPLPAGTMRLYKEDAQKSLQFIGEDAIKHTPKDEDVELKIGEAFDVVAERVQKDFQQYGRAYDTEWEIKIRNHKDTDISVGIVEPTYGDWEVISSSSPYKKVDAHTLRFDVNVPKDQEITITYKIRVRTS